MSVKIEKGGKAVLIVLAVLAVFGGLYYISKRPKDVKETALVSKGEVALPDAPVEEVSLKGDNAKKLSLPSKDPLPNSGGVSITINEMAWWAQTALNYANGGGSTTKGSLYGDAGLNVKIVRQDDCSQSCTEMVSYANSYKKGDRKDGFFVIFMGSGVDGYVYSMNKQLAALGPDYQVQGFYLAGKSYGEDQVIGDRKFKENPQSLKGAVCRGVRLDGDLDILLKYATENGVAINVDEKVYYSDRVNLSYAKDYLSAVTDYNQNLTEKRKVVVNGKTTGKDTVVGYDLVATWTPGDVNAINGRGGVTVASTKKYGAIMPSVVIGLSKFLKDNEDAVTKFIIASSQAADQIRSFEDVKKVACGIDASDEVWKEQNADYWYKLCKGYDKDKDTHLGGSMVFNLNDNAKMLGLSDGSNDVYKAVYATYSNLHSKLYPNDLPKPVDYSVAFTKRYLKNALDNSTAVASTGSALTTDYSKGDMKTVVSSKSWSIQFKTGSDEILPQSITTLDEILTEVISNDGLKVGVYGHTDNTGSDDVNIPLSEKRAQAVANYFQAHKIPSERIDVQGFGSTKPLHPEKNQSSKAAQAENRRVEIDYLGN